MLWIYKKGFLIPRHPLTNFEIQKYLKNELWFSGVCFRDNLPKKIKDGVYVINLDEYSDIGTHLIALHAINNNITYFDSFVVEHIPKEIIKFSNNKSVQTNIFRIQVYDSIMYEYFCTGFIDFMLEGNKLIFFW